MGAQSGGPEHFAVRCNHLIAGKMAQLQKDRAAFTRKTIHSVGCDALALPRGRLAFTTLLV